MSNTMMRFTRQARMSMILAQEAAEQRQESTIRAEHLLIALIREDDSIAGRVLRDDLGLDANRIEQLMDESTTPAAIPDAPLDLEGSTKKTLELAVEEARRLDHPYLSTEHLLLGLTRHWEGAETNILSCLNISPEEVRCQTLRLMPESAAQSPSTTDLGTSGEEGDRDD